MTNTATTEERLYVDAVDVKPRNFDWDASTNADYGDGTTGTTWRSWEAVEPDEDDETTCDDCGEPIRYADEEWHHAETLVDDPGDDPDYEATTEDDYDHEPTPGYDYRLDEREGPMMAYWYPCNIDDPDAAAKLIADLPLCIVEVGDEMGLALTGGGMDLSWDICEAYVRLGHCPPFHFASDLPNFAGERFDERHERILAACRRSCEFMAGAAQRGLERLDRNEAWLREQAR